MEIRKAHKYRLKVRPKHLSLLSRFAGCQRWVWNHFLHLQKERLDNELSCFNYSQMTKELTLLKQREELSFLKEAPSQTLQQTLKDLERALLDCFRKKKQFPQFKKRGKHDSFRYPQGVKVKDNKISLPKLSWIGFYNSVSAKGKICNVTVSKRGKHWFASLQTQIEVPTPSHPSTSFVGVDVGITRFATLSTGEFFSPLNSFKKLEKKLVREYASNKAIFHVVT